MQTIDLMNRLHALDTALAACQRQAIAVDVGGAGVAVLGIADGCLGVLEHREEVVHRVESPLMTLSSRSRPVFVEWNKHRGLGRYFRRFEAPRRSLPVRLAVYAIIWARFPIAVLRAASRARGAT